MKFEIRETVLDGLEVNSVNSRDVYEYLEIDTKYATWIKRAIDKYDFEEDVDYVILKNGNNPLGGRPEKDYLVTMDMAKELCMISNTPKGKETRKIFIQADKKYVAMLKRERRLAIEDTKGYGERNRNGYLKDQLIDSHFRSNPKNPITIAERDLAILVDYNDGLLKDEYKEMIFLQEKLIAGMRKRREELSLELH